MVNNELYWVNAAFSFEKGTLRKSPPRSFQVNCQFGFFRQKDIKKVSTYICCVYPRLMCRQSKVCRRKRLQKKKIGWPTYPAIKNLNDNLWCWWLRDPLTSPPPRCEFTYIYETTWPTSLRDASSANRMQEKTQLLPDDLVPLTLHVRRRVYFFTPSFHSSFPAVMSFFPPFFFFLWER